MTVIELSAYLAVGAVSGVLAGLFGIGGGAVMVPALILLFGAFGHGGDWLAHLAVGTSLATILGTGAASMLAHQRRGGVRWDLVRPLAPGIVLGALAGAGLAGWLSGPWLQRVFALFLATVGVRLLRGAATASHGSRPLPGPLGLAGVGGVIGLLSSLVGIGGGTLTVPFLTSRGLEMRQAVGTSAACGLPIAAAGALGFALVGWGRSGLPDLSSGFVYWPAVLAMLLASLPSAPLGAQLAHRLPVPHLKRLFGLLVLLIAGRLGFS
ncbi:sulfite exporter TauE/SafE family protein [Thermochromatium tepidum]|uniref:Probable membrane transporter protein n=1 Tax=Thermochromatium tepidum ATCC 43061 TaxID=316276 RepID=A0A6I6EH91_THETI|nr:sulfite exporter TauE/SafE family protein [Thermochromatium tepidum]QGU33590.1 TSUP family transporter [Thermochromatium tepidum ATCC 43061]